ncbi:hypothetical protein [Fontibacillus sp. BL9]|uniref:hypothetical protein n=1 Tax=Fontibacillus sp. BL9 TaxID=3389971 RepID=UPI0039784B99
MVAKNVAVLPRAVALVAELLPKNQIYGNQGKPNSTKALYGVVSKVAVKSTI